MDLQSVSMTTKRMGRGFRFLKVTGSTNRNADAAGVGGLPEGFLIVADKQTAARGRMGRGWFSPAGVNIYCSLLLRPDVAPGCVASLPLVIGLAVVEGLTECEPSLQPTIKWPNDIYIGDRKICGILCETQLKGNAIQHLVAGIGVNVNVLTGQLPPELRASATSIAIETGREVSREQVLATILNRFEPLYDQWRAFGFKALVQQVNMFDALRGKPVRMELAGTPLEGIASGIQPDGTLLLKTANGMKSVCSGEAHILR